MLRIQVLDVGIKYERPENSHRIFCIVNMHGMSILVTVGDMYQWFAGYAKVL